MDLRGFLEWFKRYYGCLDDYEDINTVKAAANIGFIDRTLLDGVALLGDYTGPAATEAADLQHWVDRLCQYIVGGTGSPGFEDQHPHDTVGPTPTHAEVDVVLDTLPERPPDYPPFLRW